MLRYLNIFSNEMIGFFVFHDDFLLKIELIFKVNSLAPFHI